MSDKSPEMNEALDGISQSLYGRMRSKSIEGGICVMCGKEVCQFRNDISLREYGISGMCQECQDSVFGVD